LINEAKNMADILKSECGWDGDTMTPLESTLVWYDIQWEMTLEPDELRASNPPLWTQILLQDKDWHVRGSLADIAEATVAK
jgi:hypothetical protein